MSQKKNGAPRRVSKKALGVKEEVGDMFGHLFFGTSLLLTFIILETLVIKVVGLCTAFAATGWFSFLVPILEVLFFVADAALILWWVVRSFRQLIRSIRP